MLEFHVEYHHGDHYPLVRAPKGSVPFEVVTTWMNEVKIVFGTLQDDPDLIAQGFPFSEEFFLELRFESEEQAEMVADQIRKGLVV